MNPFHNAFAATLEFASRCHAGQFDKAGDPYIWHVTRVGASLLPDISAALTGLLHDVIEDTKTDPSDIFWILELCGHFDIKKDPAVAIMNAIELLTRQPDVPYQTYIEILAASGNQLAVKVKLADLRDNLDEDRLRRAYKAGVPIEELQRLRHRYLDAYLALGGELPHMSFAPVSRLVGEVIHMPPGAVMGSEMINPLQRELRT
jgi:(p)ppGpp synthase/HD superfamily hydrolase